MVRHSGGVFVVVTVLVVAGCFFMFRRPSESAEPQRKVEFAEGAANGVPFDGKRALDHLEAVCKLGPRISGTEGMKKQQEMLKKHFEDLGAKAVFQKFSVRQVSRRQATEMANLIVSWNPDSDRRVILCSHYDTRPIADQEDDRRNWNKPFVSANDGGSGVALLMELGRHMKDLKTSVGVDFVFFDGEEFVFNPSRDGGDKYFLGSEHFARSYKKEKPKHKYAAAILLDMIGSKEARFLAEPNSFFLAGKLVEDVWQAAKDARAPLFVKEMGPFRVEDDHLSLNEAGIPAIDLIDFGYMNTHWHKLTDLPENCSGDTLAEVARVLVLWMQRMK